jgi:hypothetical protein
MGRTCDKHEEMRNAYNILVGRPEANGPLGRPRRRWKDNIFINFKGTGCEDVDCIQPVQWRPLCTHTAMIFRIV